MQRGLKHADTQAGARWSPRSAAAAKTERPAGHVGAQQQRAERAFDEGFFDHSQYHKLQARRQRRELRKKLRAIRKKLKGWLCGKKQSP
jgi:hypothetical protein